MISLLSLLHLYRSLVAVSLLHIPTLTFPRIPLVLLLRLFFCLCAFSACAITTVHETASPLPTATTANVFTNRHSDSPAPPPLLPLVPKTSSPFRLNSKASINISLRVADERELEANLLGYAQCPEELGHGVYLARRGQGGALGLQVLGSESAELQGFQPSAPGK